MDAAALCNKALERDLDAPPPASFLPEFDRHLQLFPHDDEFLLELQPGSRGVVTCMEKSCFKDITLNADPRKLEGGKTVGFGSLDAFHDHIRTSPSHQTARDTRVAEKEQQVNGIKPAKRAPVTARMSEPQGGLGGKAPSVDRKPILTGKKNARNSGGGTIILDDDDDDLPAPFSSAKRPKLDPEPNVFADRGNAVAGPAPRDDNPAAKVRPEVDYDRRLADLQAQLDETRKAPPPWDNAHFAVLDDITRNMAATRAEKLDAQRVRFGGVARGIGQLGVGAGAAAPGLGVTGINPHAGAAPVPQYGFNGGAGYAEALAQAQRAVQAQRAKDLLTAGFGGADPGSDSEGDDPMLGALAGMRSSLSGDQDLHDLLKAAAEGESFEGNHTVDEAAKKLGLKQQTDFIEGMKIPLMAHQLIGAWMVEQENSRNYGGILGDEMGLGKTIQTIATMCKQPSKDPQEKTNLIVAPVALLEQWKDEIEEKCVDNQFKILVYHGKGKEGIKKVKHLQKYDVVLTSYHTLALEWPDEEGAVKKAKKQAKKQGDNLDEDDFLSLKDSGILLKMGWYRVILDEAQNIRNRSTKISRSCAQLDSLFRWTLTGTPVTNSLADLFPLLRFLQVKPFYDWGAYRQEVVQYEKKRPDVAGRKAQAIIRSCMLRRKKDSKLDGKELVTLPEKTIELRMLEFNKEERDIYNFVEGRSQAVFNKYLRQNTVLKNYAHVLVMLLRLRQICFHPSLIADFDAEKQEIGNSVELQRAKDVLKAELVSKIRKQRLEMALERMQAEKESADAQFDGDDCPVCMTPVSEEEAGGIVTRCQHVFCRGCIDEVLAKEQVEDHDNDPKAIKYKPDERPCPNCRQPISKTYIFALGAFEPTDDELAEATGVVEEDKDDPMDDVDDEGDLKDFIVRDHESEDEDGSKPHKKVKQPNRRIIQDSDDESEAEEPPAPTSKKSKGKGKGKEESKDLPEWLRSQEPSTKMLWALEEIKRLDLEAPDDKIMVISSFTTALDLMAEMLLQNNFKVTRYQGDMSRTERDQSVKILKKSRKCKIMLMSLKCGGVGLNLTRANHVISLDLAWSNAVEAQAFDRCHRIGQTKAVQVDRLTIANTVEQRIGDMQIRKQGLADAAFGEGNGASIGKMSVSDLAGLFGITLGANGQPI